MLLYIIHLWEKFAVKINVSDQNPKVVSVLYTKKKFFFQEACYVLKHTFLTAKQM